MNLHYGKSFKIPRRVGKYFLSAIYPLVTKFWPLPKIMTIEETILKIVKDKCSIVRYGDGEIMYIVDQLNLPFQVYTAELSTKLKSILSSNHPQILIGLPLGYQTIEPFEKEVQIFWRSQISWAYPRLRRYLDLNKIYYNANITRLYYGFGDREKSKTYFELIKKVWEDREILLIEGEKSRLGVGNDLFDRARRVERILAPAHHAFNKYEELLKEALKHDKTKLVLVAMGPTAKVLVYELAIKGYQAIDIGNIDIEYEWFKMGVKERVKIKGKYTSEVVGGRIVDDLQDSLYASQIIAKIV